MFAADYNTITDRIGLPLLVAGLALLIIHDLLPATLVARPWLIWVERVIVIFAVGVIVLRFILML